MIRTPKLFTGLVLLLLILASSCDKHKDDYYARPSWLAGPIFQQLQSRGNFTLYSECLQRTGYAEILGRTGYFTVFAPNDSAFNAFLKENGYVSVNSIDSLTLRKIVEYSLANNGNSKAQLASYQNTSGWGTDMAFKRKTFYQDAFYADRGFVFVNHALKYIPYFIQSFLDNNSLTVSDYNTFFPNISYTGFNVVDAHVINADIVAENGYINEVDKVILPLPAIDEFLVSQSNYSDFKEILDKFVTVTKDVAATTKYFSYTGNNVDVYTKTYSSSLISNPGLEDLNANIANRSQITGITMMVPDNATLGEFVNTRLLKYYKTVDDIYNDNSQVLADFINAHTYSVSYLPIWPKDLGALKSKVSLSHLCSNGIVYGLSGTTLTSNFYSLFSEAYLNPSCRVMSEWIRSQSVLAGELTGTYDSKTGLVNNYTIFLPTDSAILPVLRASGFYYDKSLHQVQKLDANNLLVSAWDDDVVKKLLNLHIVKGNITSLSLSGYYETLGTDYIQIGNGAAGTAGNFENTETLTMSGAITEVNGTAYLVKTDQAFRVPAKTAGAYIASDSRFLSFYNYMQALNMFNADGSISFMVSDVYYTFLIPDNTAVAAAVAAGLPLSTATDADSKSKMRKFILYHIIEDKMIYDDGKVTGSNIFTMATPTTTSTTYEPVTITHVGNTIQIYDLQGNPPANIESADLMAKQSVIHLIDRVLKFE
jgi:uncharacterized surface protein with fasciclin (FAS1) repeats